MHIVIEGDMVEPLSGKAVGIVRVAAESGADVDDVDALRQQPFGIEMCIRDRLRNRRDSGRIRGRDQAAPSQPGIYPQADRGNRQAGKRRGGDGGYPVSYTHLDVYKRQGDQRRPDRYGGRFHAEGPHL